MFWRKANSGGGQPGETRGQFRAAVPLSQARPKTLPGLNIRGAFQAYQPAAQLSTDQNPAVRAVKPFV